MELAQVASTRVHYGGLTRDLTAALREACRAHGTTVTGAVAAAIMRATAVVIRDAGESGAAGLEGGINIGLSCAADTRKLYKPQLPPYVVSYHVSGTGTYGRLIDPVRFGVFG